LNDVLLRFSRHLVVLICDIAEMYLRIEVAPEDRSHQRFLWRSLDQGKEPEENEFNRVVFGINSSPFQARFVAQIHAEKYKDELPLAAETVMKSTDHGLDHIFQRSWGRRRMGERIREQVQSKQVFLPFFPSDLRRKC